jgi:hypothetical protein
VEQLHPFLAPGRVARLRRDGERIEQIRLGLDNLGRRRGTAPKVAAATRELLALLGQWCSEIEHAATRLPRSVLPSEATSLVAEFETFSRLHA